MIFSGKGKMVFCKMSWDGVMSGPKDDLRPLHIGMTWKRPQKAQPFFIKELEEVGGT